jgi:hypothetical protein
MAASFIVTRLGRNRPRPGTIRLGLQPGKAATVLIKSTEVAIGVE